jgi:hypothetical protein
MADLNDIFKNEKDKLSDEELLKYLDGKASDDEMHAVEKQLNNSNFENDALEGLEKFRHKENLNDYVKHLNNKLHLQLAQKKQRKHKRKIKDLPLAVITVFIILILAVLGFIVVWLFQQRI